MNGPGLLVAILALVCLTLMFVFNRQIQKVTKYYWFWMAIGIFVLVWFIAFRWVHTGKQLYEYLHTDPLPYAPGTKNGSYYISTPLLLDICPFFGIMQAICLICDPSRKVCKYISPVVFLGAFVVVFVQFLLPSTESYWTFEWFFIGTNKERLFVFLHFTSLLISAGVMINTPKFEWKGVAILGGIIALFYIYVITVCMTTGCRYYSAGAMVEDWGKDGTFNQLHNITGLAPWKCQIIGIIFCFILLGAFITFIDFFLQNTSKYRYGNVRNDKWYIWYKPNIFTIN